MIYRGNEQPTELTVEEDNLRPTIPPHSFIRFLERIQLDDALKTVHSYPTAITFEKLDQAYAEGPSSVQKIKTKYIDDLISFRASPPHHLGVAMKSRAIQLLQTMRGAKKETVGDPGTFLLDPLDEESCLAVGKSLFKQGRTNLWISFALTGDFTDAMSKHKNQRTPILGHEMDPYSGKNTPATNIEELKVYLASAKKFIRQERIEKVARKLARAEDSFYDDLLAVEQNNLLLTKMNEATTLIDRVESKTLKWSALNHYLAYLGQPPLDMHDHALIKLFPQDNQAWKIGDLRIEENTLVLEFSADQFTPREDGGILENKPKIRIEIQKDKDGKPIIITEEAADLIYLYPLLNSKDFWDRFDKKVLPLLGNSPYHQIQFMYKLGRPTKSITPETAEVAMKEGRVDFIVDIITGIHEYNARVLDQKYKNGGRNGHHNRVKPLIDKIGATNLSGATIRTPAEHELIRSESFLKEIYNLALKCSPGHKSINPEISSYQKVSLSPLDRKFAQALLKTQSAWKGRMTLPPSTFKLLQEIADGNKHITTSTQRTLLMMEGKAGIMELTKRANEKRNNLGWLPQAILKYLPLMFSE